MAKYNEYDSIGLHTGQKAQILEIFDDTHYLADTFISSGDWEQEVVEESEIRRQIEPF